MATALSFPRIQPIYSVAGAIRGGLRPQFSVLTLAVAGQVTCQKSELPGSRVGP